MTRTIDIPRSFDARSAWTRRSSGPGCTPRPTGSMRSRSTGVGSERTFSIRAGLSTALACGTTRGSWTTRTDRQARRRGTDREEREARRQDRGGQRCGLLPQGLNRFEGYLLNTCEEARKWLVSGAFPGQPGSLRGRGRRGFSRRESRATPGQDRPSRIRTSAPAETPSAPILPAQHPRLLPSPGHIQADYPDLHPTGPAPDVTPQGEERLSG